jgi:predicted dehydrogenase
MGGRLRVGIVGCGRIAMAHAAALRFLADDGLLEVVAAADPDPAGVETVASIAGTVPHRGSDGFAVISHPDVDAVVVTAPTRFHRDYVAAVAEARKPLFTEKPLAPTYPMVEEIVGIVRAAGIPAQVGFQSRFHPILRRVRKMVVSNEHGAPMAYTLRDDQFWPTGAVVPGHTDWRSDRSEAGGGALLEHSIHSCDVLTWLFGPVRRVYALTRSQFGFSVEDCAALTIEHDSGVIGNLVTVFNGVQHREERRLEVFFEQASVETTTDFVIGAPEDSLLVHRGADEAAVVHDPDAVRREAFAAEGFDPDRQVFVYQYFAYHAFVTALQARATPSPGIDDAYAAHTLVEAAYRSAAERRPVDLAEIASLA